MENKETSTNDSYFADISELGKKMQCLEVELMQVNARMLSLEELLLLAENVLSQCTCHALKEQVSSLLSSMQRFVPTTGSDDSPAVSRLQVVDVATQCDGEDLVFSSLTSHKCHCIILKHHPWEPEVEVIHSLIVLFIP